MEVIDRNRLYDAFGLRAVFADATMEAMKIRDAETAVRIPNAFNHWDDVEPLFKRRRLVSIGGGLAGVGRKRLLNILQADKRRTLAGRRAELGEEIPFARLAEPRNVTGALLWLVCEAAGFVKGEAISISGGEVMR